MRALTFETVSPSHPGLSLPFHLEQTSSRTAPLLMLGLIVPAAAALLFPLLLLAFHVLTDPAARAVLAEQPGSAVQLTLAVAFWAVLFAWPVKRALDALTHSRSVRIEDGAVRVADRSLSGARNFIAPLASYSGLAHHVRASLSGTRHELILVHPNRDWSVLVMISDRMTQPEIDRLAQILRQQEVPSRELYRRVPSPAIRVFEHSTLDLAQPA